MTTQTPRGAYPQSYLPHVGSEFEGHAPADASSTDEAVENAMATIRDILTEERRTSSRRSLPDLAPGLIGTHLVPRPKRRAKQPQSSVSKGRASRRLAGLGTPAALMARLKGLRPKPVHSLWLAAFGLVLWWPMLVLVILFIAFWLVVLGAAVFGVERMQGLRAKVIEVLPTGWALPKGWPPLMLRRRPEEDPFEAMPDPFERIRPEPH
ncbi:MAG: hypothetical protein RQ750_15905 [Roseovarius sp.]|nr:hypothetical protein [Roseovarius sp.]